MASTRAASVPGRMGIHWSAWVAALGVKRGSMTTTRAPPCSMALIMCQVLPAPEVRFSAKLSPNSTMSLELARSLVRLPVRLPYT